MRPVHLAILLLAIAVAHSSAQSVRGSIGGTVTDASHQALRGAGVTLTDEATNKKREAATDARGEFLISLVPRGAYRLEVERDGYRKHVQLLALAVDQELRVDVPLLVGNRTETIEITALRTMVRTDSAALGTAIENRKITGLPLDGRNFYELALLIAGRRRPRHRGRRVRSAATSRSTLTARARTRTTSCWTASTTATPSSTPLA